MELVKRGEKLGLWKYKEATNELVQKETPSKGTTSQDGALQDKSSQPKAVEGDKGAAQK